MELILVQISIFLTALYLGGMVFFAFFMAPLIFIKLPATTAGSFIREVFPWYYLVLALLSLALGIFLITLSYELLALLITFNFLGFVFARQILMPKINEYRDASEDSIFKLLHKISVFLNSFQLLLVLIVFYVLIK